MTVKIAKVFQALTYWPIYGFFRFFTHYQIEGQENLKGLEDRAIIFASNHASYIDGPISAASMPRSGLYPKNFSPIRFLAWKKFFGVFGQFPFPISIPIMLYVKFNGSIPIEKASGDLFKALREVIKELKAGAKIWIFPEGGITKDGKLQQGKRGIAFLHQQTNVPVVPVALMGTFGILSLKTFLRQKKVKIRIGKPIYDLGNASLEEGVNIVMREIGKLLVPIS